MIGRARGTVVGTRGHLLEAALPFACVGDGVRVRTRGGAETAARVVSVHRTHAVLAPFRSLDGVAAGDRVDVDPIAHAFALGTALLGRGVDPAGAALDGGFPVRGLRARAWNAPSPAQRRPCAGIAWTGVRAIDGPLALGRGARIGLFGPPGAGKSTLLDAVISGAAADAVVVALVGERGREAERRLACCRPDTTVVCAPSDRGAAERLRAAELAFAQADALRRRGLDVLLVLDSLARVCAAAREIALAAGEAAGRGGYPPSVFAAMSALLERAGAFDAGSITLVATILSDGPGGDDPVSEAARAALDGHVVLSARLARAGRFPAIDVAASTSRTMAEVASREHRAAAGTLRAAVAALEESQDARALGLGASADPFLARCVAAEPQIERFLRQDTRRSAPGETLTELLRLADILGDGRPR